MKKTPSFHLDEQIIIQTAIVSVDDTGGQILTWQNLATVFASVTTTAIPENFKGQQLQAATRYAFTIRNRADIQLPLRIIWREQTLRVVALPDVSPRQLYRLLITTNDNTL